MFKNLLNDFKAFVTRGNVVDLAVGIIIGAAFTAIVNSLVSDVIMPPIGWAMGNIDFSNFYYNPGGQEFASLDDARKAGAPVIAYGLLINNVIKFFIVALAVFLLVRWVKKIEHALAFDNKDPSYTTDQKLLMEIRDALKERK